MAVEVKELIIRATVDPSTEDQKGSRKKKVVHDDLVQECVETVLEILKEREER